MWLACPLVFRMLTPSGEVWALAAQVLRIELVAEPLFAVSIVASGALRGAEDTLVPSILNLLSIWVVRIGLSLLLVGRLGLHGEKGAALWKRKAAIPVFVILNAMDAAHAPPHAAAAERKIGKP